LFVTADLTTEQRVTEAAAENSCRICNTQSHPWTYTTATIQRRVITNINALQLQEGKYKFLYWINFIYY